MVLKSEAPDIDLVSFSFENQGGDQDKPVFIDANDPSRFITSRRARTVVRQLVAGLKAEGLQPGDCVCVHSFNEIHYPLLYWGIIGAGGRFTGSNPSYTSYELIHHVRTAKAKFLIGEPHMLPTILTTATECGIPTSKVFVFDAYDRGSYDGQRSWEELLRHGQMDWIVFDNPKDARTTVAMLSFTSGTTGLPKAAMIPHHFSVSQIHGIQSPPNKPYNVSRLMCLPSFHAFAIPLVSGCALREQHPVYLMRRFDLKHYIEAIKRFRITELPMVPTMMISILTSPLTTKRALRSIRYVWLGGSPLRYSTQADFQALLSPKAKISQVWGMTETGWTAFRVWPDGDNTGSVGKTLLGMSMKLIDENGNAVEGDGKEGEILVKGPCMMLGYLDNLEATANAIDANGWLKTGDIGYCRQGLWYVVDRKKDIIKVHGWQVAPTELEAVLVTHPQIISASVIGIPIADGTGEVPRAYVVRRPNHPNRTVTNSGMDEGRDVGEEEIQAYLASRLAKYKALTGGVEFVNEIPRNASGKALKFKLREMVKKTKDERVMGTKD